MIWLTFKVIFFLEGFTYTGLLLSGIIDHPISDDKNDQMNRTDLHHDKTKKQ
jgi:hypothetical protein